MDVGNLTSGSSASSRSSLNIWKFSVHILLKPGFRDYLSPIKLSSQSLCWHTRPLDLLSRALPMLHSPIPCFLLHTLIMASHAKPCACGWAGTPQVFEKPTASSFLNTPACLGDVSWDCRAGQRPDLERRLYDMLWIKAVKALMGSNGRALIRGVT